VFPNELIYFEVYTNHHFTNLMEKIGEKGL